MELKVFSKNVEVRVTQNEAARLYEKGSTVCITPSGHFPSSTNAKVFSKTINDETFGMLITTFKNKIKPILGNARVSYFEIR
jgi:hypothetical protein